MYRFLQPAGKPLHYLILCYNTVVSLGVPSESGTLSLFCKVDPMSCSAIYNYIFLIKLNKMLYAWVRVLWRNGEYVHI